MPQSFDPVFEQWYTENQLGSGTDGKVYSIIRKNADGSAERSVLKMIRLGENRSEKKSFNTIVEKDEAGDSEESYYETIIKNITDNIAVIQRVDNGKRFVKYEEWETRRTSDGKGYAVLIRLERARSLTDLLSELSFTLDETLRIGVSICRSLVRCRDFGYIYPNLKPENILFDEKGICKLGDFGSFSCLEPSKTSLAFKRTQYYMAPEFIRTGNVNGTVDTYSLGLVLYSLINRGRLPFTEKYPEKVTVSSLDLSMQKRLDGEELPEPALCDEALFRIIKKACAYKVEERYLSPKQMLADLKNALEKKPFEETVYEDIYSVSSEGKEPFRTPSEPEPQQKTEQAGKPPKAVSLREEIQIPDVTPMDYAGREVKPRKKRPSNFEALPAARKKEADASSVRKLIILALIALVLLVLFVASVAMKMKGDTGTTILPAASDVSNTLMIYGGYLFYGV
ncbi:MAG: protein kinase [Oscillospiraceae bacterium]|nr:protein kinase [Oscillospiraceae bacterium]MDD7293428.1 protein kinase [Clostridiaceae bacterium]MDY5991148.1 protein kinase [Oscillospiraceae bacterium]